MITIPAVKESCAGIDVGKRGIAVAVMTGPADKEATVQTRWLGTTVPELEALREWLLQEKVTSVAMESTGSYWILDLSCNGTFDSTPTDAVFPFGGLSGDVPVVGKWAGGTTKVGMVRKYAPPGGVPQGNPFYWVLDAGTANAGSTPADHQPDYGRVFAFGGLTGDVFVVGDWYNTGVSSAGVYRTGFWVLDDALPGEPQPSHFPGMTFGYGGVPTDVPITGHWGPSTAPAQYQLTTSVNPAAQVRLPPPHLPLGVHITTAHPSRLARPPTAGTNLPVSAVPSPAPPVRKL